MSLDKNQAVSNAGDREQLREAKKRAFRSKKLEQDAYQWLLNEERGRRVVWNLLEHCNVFSISYRADSDQTIFNEGRRSAGNYLLNKIMEINPEAYSLMVKESKKEA